MQKIFYTIVCTCMYGACLAQQARQNTNPIPKSATNNPIPVATKPQSQQYEKDKRERDYQMNKVSDEERRQQQLWNQLSANNQSAIASLNSQYPILELNPENNSKEIISLNSIGEIKLIDMRPDKLKIGFLPVQPELTKKGYTTIGLQFDKNLNKWLKENFFDSNITTDTNSNRKLVIVMQKFWFSNTANERFTAGNPKLATTLNYHFDVFTNTEKGYYPQKNIKGGITTLYQNGNAYSYLTDSLLSLLKKEFILTDFLAKENESNWQSPIEFNDYCNSKIIRISQFSKLPKGVYANYADFLEKKVLCDSIDMVVKYTNYDHAAPLYACNIIAFREGRYIPTNKSWGFFDGHTIFLNTGDGFYIKLTPAKEGYIFLHLKNIEEDKIKKYILDGIQIGNSPYQTIKNYSTAFALTFQLDQDSGKLY